MNNLSEITIPMVDVPILDKIKWGLDMAHSEVGFKVKHMMVANVRGLFKEFEASIVTTGEDFMTAEIDFWLDPSSVDTGSSDRDKHIRSADFFDVEQFKQIHFTGNTYEEVDHDGSYELYGDLTIKGITRRIKLDVEFGGILKDPWGNQKAIFNINGKINRKDWGLNWNAALETGGILVGEEVSIRADLQLFKQ
ncbi:MAG: YceI family protein [Saprospiraceae bacterium]|nr:YceI family protein [Saprospiraceae bacterium]